MPSAAWPTPVAVQNRITRSCAVSGGVVLAIATPPSSFWRTPPLRPRASPGRRAAFVVVKFQPIGLGRRHYRTFCQWCRE
jgi:hypothetical protein